MADTYTVERVIELVRERLDDRAEPYLVSDQQIATALDIAQREFVEETLCLTNSSSYTIDVVADTAWYDVDPSIMHIRNGYLRTARTELAQASEADISDFLSAPDYGQIKNDWRSAEGTPQYMVTDLETDKIRLVPSPIQNDTLELSVHPYPTLVAESDTELSIPDIWRPTLVAGACAQLYRTDDAELYDAQAADRALGEWKMHLSRARAQYERNNRGPGRVHMARTGVW